MFELLLWTAAGISLLGILIALDGSRDVFHPLVFIGPMFIFLYAWMPSRLLAADGLARYFDPGQLIFIQTLYVCGIAAFVLACLSVGVGVRVGVKVGVKSRASARTGQSVSLNGTTSPKLSRAISPAMCRRLLIGGAVAGAIGLGCWSVTIINVGGFVNAFSASYSGGWDDSGYVRDGSLLMLVGVLMAVSSLAAGGPKVPGVAMMALFGLPWTAQALLMARRGPTFAIAAIVMMGWYLTRRKRPPLVAMAAAGFLLGWLALFLVTNRSNIYLGSDFNVTSSVGDIVEKPDTGNEYIYGGGAILSAERRDHYFWMRRYLAQIMVRPIPSAIWPTKYADFGVPELLENAGNGGSGFGDALGWVGAVGSAPGIVADLWVEAWWLAVVLMAALGWLYGWVWKQAVTRGGPWTAQYVILSALSIYLVMQTMEAVIFRSLLLSIPCWLTWRWALRAPLPQNMAARRGAAFTPDWQPERLGSERIGSERTGSERVGSEQVGSEQIGSKRTQEVRNA